MIEGEWEKEREREGNCVFRLNMHIRQANNSSEGLRSDQKRQEKVPHKDPDKEYCLLTGNATSIDNNIQISIELLNTFHLTIMQI